MMKFSAKIYKIGINPYVLLPPGILKQIFKEANKTKGPISVSIKISEHNFIQTLVKYSGKWRLYLNGPMRKAAGKDVGDTITIEIQYDANERIIPMHPKLESAINKNKKAKNVFDKLPPSRQKEILRYINSLKTKESIDRNIKRAIGFLSGEERFVGRDKP
ncbi:MAG: YdeI/OmpD-associated family protein [Ginsengibacter sp.]